MNEGCRGPGRDVRGLGVKHRESDKQECSTCRTWCAQLQPPWLLGEREGRAAGRCACDTCAGAIRLLGLELEGPWRKTASASDAIMRISSSRLGVI
jgi:hypothetical protein